MPTTAPSSSVPAPRHGMPHVLIVDDEPRLRELIGTALRKWGFTADTARSGEEALRQVDRREPDIVILDLNLPGMGGLDCLRALREQKCDAAAIVLTGYGDLAAARQAFRLDVVEFLSKPVPLGELEQALDRARRCAAQLRLAHAEPVIAPTLVAPVSKLDQVERNHILATLTKNDGNRTATAVELGISRRTLQYRLAEYQDAGWVEETR